MCDWNCYESNVSFEFCTKRIDTWQLIEARLKKKKNTRATELILFIIFLKLTERCEKSCLPGVY